MSLRGQCGRGTFWRRLFVSLLRWFLGLGDVVCGRSTARLFVALLRLFDRHRRPGRGTHDIVGSEVAAGAGRVGRDSHGGKCDYDGAETQERFHVLVLRLTPQIAILLSWAVLRTAAGRLVHHAHRSSRRDLRVQAATDPLKFGTHSPRRTKAMLIYRRTGNLRAVQLLLGHTKIASTVRYLGIEIDDAIEIAEKVEV